MLPKWHLLFGFVFAYILIYFFQFSLLAGTIVFLSSILIDIDHYLRYVYLEKDLSPIKFWNWSMQRKKRWEKLSKKEKSKYKYPQFFLHGIEFWVIIFLLSFNHQIFLWMLIGIIFHMFFDISDLIYKKIPSHVKLSQVYNYITNKTKKEFK